MIRARVFIIGFLIFAGCSSSTGPETSASSDNQASFFFNGTQHVISIHAEPNGYVPGEVVIRGSGEALENTLMITFEPAPGAPAQIDTQMTGYWDLVLCIPFNKYLLSQESTNYLRITSYDRTSGLLTGEFNLTFRFEKDISKVASFSNGFFRAKIDTTHAFTYCIEG